MNRTLLLEKLLDGEIFVSDGAWGTMFLEKGLQPGESPESWNLERPDDIKDIFTVLNKIVKHRAALINVFKKIPLIDWERTLKDSDGNEISLYDFASGMVQSERKILKEIADLVLIHQNEKLKTREINQRVEHRKSETN